MSTYIVCVWRMSADRSRRRRRVGVWCHRRSVWRHCRLKSSSMSEITPAPSPCSPCVLVTSPPPSPSSSSLFSTPRSHDTTGCQTGWTTGCVFTRRERLDVGLHESNTSNSYNRLNNRLNNRLYRVNGVLQLAISDKRSGMERAWL